VAITYAPRSVQLCTDRVRVFRYCLLNPSLNTCKNGEKMAIPRVLLADDDEAVREMLQVALERDSFEIVAVADKRRAQSHCLREL
jgi:PleD family two-component response regulator